MRVSTVATFLFASLLAGCMDLDRTPGDNGPAPSELYEPDCSISNWRDRCVARASPNDSPSKAEIDIVANPTDPLNAFVASKDLDRDASGCVWAVGQASHDGGHTWTTSYVGGTKEERQPQDPLYGWGCITDPIMSFDSQGRLYYALQAYNYGTESNEPPNPCQPAMLPGGTNSGSQFFLAMSDDGGLAWNRIIVLHTGEGNVVYHDYPRMANNPITGSIFVIWNQFNTVGLPCDPVGVGTGVLAPVLSGTRDRGQTPIQPVYPIPPNHPDFGNFDMNGFAAGADGEQGVLYVTLDTEDGNTSTVYLIESRDDGRTWTAPAKIFDYTQVTAAPGQGRAHTPSTRFRAGSSVELAVDNSDGPFNGCLYGNWIDNGTGDWDVMVSRSCDDGKQWTTPVRVNQDNEGAYQFMTRPVVSSDGVVHVVYQTQAYDPQQRLIDAEYAFSEDGGESWTVRRLTEVQTNGDLGIHQDGGSFFGDYNGIAASGTTVYAGFTHTLTGKAEIAVARMERTTT
jgi:hypothetical protein